MLTLLKVVGWVWLAAGAVALRRNIEVLARVTEATHPAGSSAVTAQVVSAVLVFVLPSAAVLLIDWFLSDSHRS